MYFTDALEAVYTSKMDCSDEGILFSELSD